MSGQANIISCKVFGLNARETYLPVPADGRRWSNRCTVVPDPEHDGSKSMPRTWKNCTNSKKLLQSPYTAKQLIRFPRKEKKL